MTESRHDQIIFYGHMIFYIIQLVEYVHDYYMYMWVPICKLNLSELYSKHLCKNCYIIMFFIIYMK